MLDSSGIKILETDHVTKSSVSKVRTMVKWLVTLVMTIAS